jgi:hypothetical protein
MRNPENNDKLSSYSAADRAIMQASMNASRLANKKGTAKKAVAKKAVAKKAATPKPTDSRFSGVKKPSPTKPTDSRFSGLGAGKPKSSGMSGYTPGSTKNNKATYTTGSGVRYASSSTKPTATAQKTKDLKKNPLVKFVTSRVGGKSGGTGKSK